MSSMLGIGATNSADPNVGTNVSGGVDGPMGRFLLHLVRQFTLSTRFLQYRVLMFRLLEPRRNVLLAHLFGLTTLISYSTITTIHLSVLAEGNGYCTLHCYGT